MPQKNQSIYPVFVLLILASLAVWPSAATAVVAPTAGGGRIGYLPLQPTAVPFAPQSRSLHATEPTGFPPLEYHGGPVMHSQQAFAVFWKAPGYSFPAGYETALTTYLENVAADSGKTTNVYSVSAQYEDEGAQHALYQDSYGGSATDIAPYGNTCPAYNGYFGAEFTACVTDEKIQEALTSLVSAEGLPNGLGTEFYVVLPPEVGSCFEEGSGEYFCFDAQEGNPEGFCAYHNFIEGSELVYSNISYSPEDPIGCGVGEYPNGHANGNADDMFSSLSHEANESITDPTLEAWYDEEGFENGDECRNSSDDYGSPLGGSTGTLYNQEIGTNHYYLQQEWSNDIEDCAQRVEPAEPVIAGPGAAAPGEAVSFNGFSSIEGSGPIESYEWNFGDGSEAEGGEVTHAYAALGTYAVTLTVHDDGGFGYSKSRQIAIKAPEEPSGGGGGGSGGGSGSGSGSAGGGTASGSSNSSSSSSSGSAPAPAAGVAVAAARAKVKHRVARVKLTCKGGACSGVVKLLDHGVIGHASFHLRAGTSKVIKVRLTSGGLTLLAKKPGGLKVSLSGTGIRHRTLTLTFK